jgi:hypothetical protein
MLVAVDGIDLHTHHACCTVAHRALQRAESCHSMSLSAHVCRLQRLQQTICTSLVACPDGAAECRCCVLCW